MYQVCSIFKGPATLLSMHTCMYQNPTYSHYSNSVYSTVIIMSMYVLQELKAPAGLAMARE